MDTYLYMNLYTNIEYIPIYFYGDASKYLESSRHEWIIDTANKENWIKSYSCHTEEKTLSGHAQIIHSSTRNLANIR